MIKVCKLKEGRQKISEKSKKYINVCGVMNEKIDQEQLKMKKKLKCQPLWIKRNIRRF